MARDATAARRQAEQSEAALHGLARDLVHQRRLALRPREVAQAYARFRVLCALRDGAKAGEYLKGKLGIDYNETTADGQFTLKEGECMGACGDAPVMLVNDRQMLSYMSSERLDELLALLKANAQ